MRIEISPWYPAPKPAPKDEAILAIGDIHGMHKQLASLQDALVKEFNASGALKGTLVRLGDYIDRGDDSLAALKLVAAGLDRDDIEEVNLLGNHDAWLADGLAGHLDGHSAHLWVRNGGGRALEDFDIPSYATAEDLTAHLRDKLPLDVKVLVRNLAIDHRIGEYLFVHAGLDPRRELDWQTDEAKLWIRDEFLYCEDWPFDVFVIHGHTPERDIGRHFPAHRIGLDSGCFSTKAMTGLIIHGDRLRFIQAIDGHRPPTWQSLEDFAAARAAAGR